MLPLLSVIIIRENNSSLEFFLLSSQCRILLELINQKSLQQVVLHMFLPAVALFCTLQVQIWLKSRKLLHSSRLHN